MIPDEIVIDNEDGLAPTEIEERIQFCENLSWALSSRSSSIKCNDVAKLALEWAAARELDAHRDIAVDSQ